MQEARCGYGESGALHPSCRGHKDCGTELIPMIQGSENYNILQNNGRPAHQVRRDAPHHLVTSICRCVDRPVPTSRRLARSIGVRFTPLDPMLTRLDPSSDPRTQVVDHVHFHVIPKPADGNDKEGLVIGWPSEWADSGTRGGIVSSYRADRSRAAQKDVGVSEYGWWPSVTTTMRYGPRPARGIAGGRGS
jgi:diadenosine tetraphosphate (Ap4A) HIT family hydrolase